MRQAMLLVAARQGVEDVLDARLGAEIETVLDGLGAGGQTAVLMRQVPDDPFREMFPLCRSFDAVVQFSIDGVPDERAVGSLAGLGVRLDDVIHADLSGVVVGDAYTEVGPADSDSRYLYPWRHKAGRTLEECQAHWRDQHAEFGRRLPSILGYDQFHTDRLTSKAAARAADLGVWQPAGVVVLHLPSVQEFIDAVVGTEISTDALEDELNFMDTANGAGEAVAVVRRWPS